MSFLMQFIIYQTLNPSLLTSGKSTWTPLILLPDILSINYFLIDYFCFELIMNIFHFYAPTCFPKIQSFMYSLTIFPILITALRIVIESRQLQAFILAMLKERTIPMIFIFFLNSPSFVFLLIHPIFSFLTHLVPLFLSLPFIQ